MITGGTAVDPGAGVGMGCTARRCGTRWGTQWPERKTPARAAPKLAKALIDAMLTQALKACMPACCCGPICALDRLTGRSGCGAGRYPPGPGRLPLSRRSPRRCHVDDRMIVQDAVAVRSPSVNRMFTSFAGSSLDGPPVWQASYRPPGPPARNGSPRQQHLVSVAGHVPRGQR